MAKVRTAARVDGNHAKIVNGLRLIGASVLDTHQLPNCFDILVGYGGRNIIMEIKDPAQPLSGRQLTSGEAQFKATWRGGEYYVVETLDQAIKIITNEKLRKTSPKYEGTLPHSTLCHADCPWV